MVRIWHFSDTHGQERTLNVPTNIDLAIFSGDCSNPRNSALNEPEVRNFIEWYSNLNIPYKIFIAGNHDSSIESGLVTKKDFQGAGIIYLENESIEILGLKIWGSPITPTFGNWCFMKARHKLHDLWITIPEDTDIVVTHGPPKGCLDLSFDRDNNLEFCGCESLRKRIFNIKPKLHLFGHIHNMPGISNQGVLQLSNLQTKFSNGSCVMDGKLGEPVISHGNIFEI
jgi:Icc-related predicted phosphoesterase